MIELKDGSTTADQRLDRIEFFDERIFEGRSKRNGRPGAQIIRFAAVANYGQQRIGQHVIDDGGITGHPGGKKALGVGSRLITQDFENDLICVGGPFPRRYVT